MGFNATTDGWHSLHLVAFDRLVAGHLIHKAERLTAKGVVFFGLTSNFQHRTLNAQGFRRHRLGVGGWTLDVQCSSKAKTSQNAY